MNTIEKRRDKCSNICHSKCVNEKDDETICHACNGVKDNLADNLKKGQHDNTSLKDTVDPHKEVSNSSPLGTANINSISGQIINRSTSSACMHPISSSPVYTVPPASLSTTKNNQPTMVTCSGVSTSSVGLSTSVVSVSTVMSRVSHTASSRQQQTSVKAQDLRSREEKVRKKEDELKQKQYIIDNTEKKRKDLETYVEKTEARNLELEQTVRILRRRLAAYEEKGHVNDQEQVTNGQRQRKEQ